MSCAAWWTNQSNACHVTSTLICEDAETLMGSYCACLVSRGTQAPDDDDDNNDISVNCSMIVTTCSRHV